MKRTLTILTGYLLAIMLAGWLLAASGCAVVPNTVRLEGVHQSHMGQHFGAHQTNYGAQYAEVVARWQMKGAYVDLGQGYNLSPGLHNDWTMSCPGGLCGPRELTTVAIGYEWQLK